MTTNNQHWLCFVGCQLLPHLLSLIFESSAAKHLKSWFPGPGGEMGSLFLCPSLDKETDYGGGAGEHENMRPLLSPVLTTLTSGLWVITYDIDEVTVVYLMHMCVTLKTREQSSEGTENCRHNHRKYASLKGVGGVVTERKEKEATGRGLKASCATDTNCLCLGVFVKALRRIQNRWTWTRD